MSAALALLVSADVLLSFGETELPERITLIALALLLGAFALLLTTGTLAIAKKIVQTCFDFFSAQQRSARRLLFIQNKEDQLKQLFLFKTVQINFFNKIKRKRLLTANNRKHINSLSSTIADELKAMKPHLPKADFAQFQQDNRYYRNQLDAEGLLKLQQKIAALTKS